MTRQYNQNTYYCILYFLCLPIVPLSTYKELVSCSSLVCGLGWESGLGFCWEFGLDLNPATFCFTKTHWWSVARHRVRSLLDFFWKNHHILIRSSTLPSCILYGHYSTAKTTNPMGDLDLRYSTEYTLYGGASHNKRGTKKVLRKKIII